MKEFDPGDAPSIASITDQVRALPVGMPVTSIYFLGDTAVFVLGEETLVFASPDSAQRVAVHTGAILASASDGKRIVTGGDDGDVIATDAAGHLTVLATDTKRRWIDRVALGPDGAVAWAAGKQAYVQAAKGDPKVVEAPSSIGGLAFAPKGFRLAIAHYNGVTLWFPNLKDAKPEFLDWKGSHLGVTFSPDGKFLVTSMQEIHAARLAAGRQQAHAHVRLAAKVRSMDWSPGGKWLATSGSDQLILWPFSSKDGPMGKQPQMLAPSDVHRVAAVACHPT